LGPSAHSFDLVTRQWNVSDLKSYVESLLSDGAYFGQETLTLKDHYNEYIMLSLRTIWGINTVKLKNDFGDELLSHFIHAIQPYMITEHLIADGNQIIMTKKGWLISDYIISDLIV
jgi:oxygen-independent coproporphyrinogen-3 oxidase